MTEPSKKALDYAARKVGFSCWANLLVCAEGAIIKSVEVHARTLDELWAIKPPMTRGELFAEELFKRWRNGDLRDGSPERIHRIAAEMIDEGWEPKDD